MTSLDTLARSASEAITESVADLPVPIGAAGVGSGVAGAWKVLTYAAAGAAAAVAVLVVLLTAPATQDDAPTDSSVPTTVVSTTIAEQAVSTTIQQASEAPPPEAPVVIVEDDPEPAEPAPDTQPPHLVVTSPANGEHLETKTARFAGSTEPGARVVASGKFVADVDSEGSWTIELVLASGANGVVFVASDEAGNETEVRMTVYLDAEEPKETTTTTTTIEASWDFTANQKYGSCSEPVPYDEFSGYAKPGSTVTISSEFGSGSAKANEDGNWFARVEFPSAPFGETFAVKVKDAFGSVRSFNFVSNYSG